MVQRSNALGEQRSWRMATCFGGMTCIKPSKIVYYSLFYSLLSLIFVQSTLSLDFKGENSKTFSQCEKCKIVVESFKDVSVFTVFCSFLNTFFFQGLKRTANGKHEGGDAHWEEKKLRNYANSEIRLIEIQESLCHEVSLGKDQV